MKNPKNPLVLRNGLESLFLLIKSKVTWFFVGYIYAKERLSVLLITGLQNTLNT